MPVKKTLLIDFDGVLHHYEGDMRELGPPISGSRAACHLLSRTYKLVVFTSRTNFVQIDNWLATYGFPRMPVTNMKRPAHLIIEDRALTFDGHWSDHFIAQIKSFQPHWNQGVAEPAPPETPDPSEAEEFGPEAL